MKVLVVYESMFGNTEAIAHAVAEGLSGRADVQLREVATAPASEQVDLIVAGGPTHAFSLSRPSTRAQAITQGATHGTASMGLREWLGELPRATQVQSLAAFDTRVEKMRRLPGSAAAKTARIAHHLGYASGGHQSFYVLDTAGPLMDGELERARTWGVLLGADVSKRTAAQTRG